MSVVLMSKRELNRLDVLARLDSDRLSVAFAAGLMNITPRQTYRLLSRYRDGGASAIATSGGAVPRTTGCRTRFVIMRPLWYKISTRTLAQHWRP
ncbi:MAG TPA: helix-turn-helix domain-containing protein, partial [Candidatus Acidoferrales bacterium]